MVYARLLLEEKLSAVRLTDEVCRETFRIPDGFRQIRTISTSSGPSGHLPLKGKA